ncbi:alpha/beta fold hydrolase [Kangiella sp. HZ709]|uniref:alpha/beta hydrolase family protein n=1 Tax=Kangiella sp. HZ709 TaxID=2666328 RepID=UPI0012B0C03B|nr:alpha/beta fold hydrolase [Kangiella sp. HZ709]
MPPYPHQKISFNASDGYQLQGALYTAADSKRFIIVGSAFGVPYQYYKHIADFFRDNGINVLLFDYRGISHSKKGSMPTLEILMQHWGQLDVEAAIVWVSNQFAPEKLYYLGHSAGGQILGLAPSSPRVNKVIIAASGIASWREWPGMQKLLLAAVWYLIFPVAKLFQSGDYFHSKFLGPIPVPKNAVNQWLSWARSEEYLFTAKHQLDLSAYPKIQAEILGLSISDDWYAPYQARDGLLKQYVACDKQTRVIKPKDLGLKAIGHFGLFKKKQEIQDGIWQPMLNFLNGTNDER